LPSWVLSAGVDHQTQGIDAGTDGVNDLTRQRRADAVYGGLVYSQAAHSVQFNLRHDSVQGLAAKDAVYLGYGYDLNPQWKLIASHSTAFNVPPLGYLFDPYAGNPTLRPETATTDEVGVQWAQGPHRLRATLFDTRTKDLLLYDMSTWQFSNVSSVKNQGLETSYSGRIQATDLRASLTLQDPVNEATGQTLVRRAKTLASASLSQAVGLLTLGASVRYTGARPDLASKPELPSYVLLDLTARYALARDWTLFGRVENATDSRYQTAYGYNQLPRTTTLGLSWKFKS
jgi:vitamin B12 transporter